jgi:hypothetical protein
VPCEKAVKSATPVDTDTCRPRARAAGTSGAERPAPLPRQAGARRGRYPVLGLVGSPAALYTLSKEAHMSGQPFHVVTGAFGYSGRYIAARLLDAGFRVRTITELARSGQSIS